MTIRSLRLPATMMLLVRSSTVRRRSMSARPRHRLAADGRAGWPRLVAEPARAGADCRRAGPSWPAALGAGGPAQEQLLEQCRHGGRVGPLQGEDLDLGARSAAGPVQLADQAEDQLHRLFRGGHDQAVGPRVGRDGMSSSRPDSMTFDWFWSVVTKRSEVVLVTRPLVPVPSPWPAARGPGPTAVGVLLLAELLTLLALAELALEPAGDDAAAAAGVEGRTPWAMAWMSSVARSSATAFLQRTMRKSLTAAGRRSCRATRSGS